ncbi:MAG: Flp pilus assembly complex ATPase component TadA [Bdellovibrionales bacterium]|nr:Flp pilus assembly complex ATPase component TadA [Bdellovibrionales bacterium]
MHFSSWIRSELCRAGVTDLLINGNRSAFRDEGNGLRAIETPELKPDEVRTWALSKMSETGKAWDARFPFVDLSFVENENPWRMHLAFAPMTEMGILISLRRLRRETHRQAGDARWGSSRFWEMLLGILERKETLLISGSTGSGKTTLMNDLLTRIQPTERILALEDTRELDPDHPHFLALVSRTANAEGQGEVTLRDLLKQSLRMRPDRIVVGECRGAEVLELLQALNTGHRGTLATLHANSPRDALRRLEWMALLHGGSQVPIQVIRELIATGIQWVVQIGRTTQGREIEDLWKVEGREGDAVLMRRALP